MVINGSKDGGHDWPASSTVGPALSLGVSIDGLVDLTELRNAGFGGLDNKSCFKVWTTDMNGNNTLPIGLGNCIFQIW